jgi:hypothetical protein
LPNDRYDRDVDIRENIFRSRQDGAATKEKHHQSEHIERVPKTQREADDSHSLSFEKRP